MFYDQLLREAAGVGADPEGVPPGLRQLRPNIVLWSYTYTYIYLSLSIYI